MAKKQLIQGKDYHAWACKIPRYKGQPEADCVFGYWATTERPSYDYDTKLVQWVRVKFVEVADG